MRTLTVLLLTGGPGGGKTESAAWLKKKLEEEGFGVVVVPEAATELLLAGLDWRNSMENFDFQKAQLELGLFREELYKQYGSKLYNPNVIMLCDRGVLDGSGFIEPELFDKILQEKGLDRNELLKRYDAIFHLETAGRNNDNFYTLKNNKARIETASEAAMEDEILVRAYKNHPCHVIIHSQKDVEAKFSNLLCEVNRFLAQKGIRAEQRSQV